MAFTQWLEDLKQLGGIAQVLAALGIVTVFLAILKHQAERRCWRRFKKIAYDWIDRLVATESRHPNELADDEWKVECERMLVDANFSPLQIEQLLEVSVVVAKGIVADKIFK